MIKVLVADDANLLRQRLVALLHTVEGITTVVESSDCAGTIAAIDNECPDLIVLDLNFPDGSGLDVLHALSRRSRRPRVLMLSAFGDPEVRQRCLDVGAERFFDKGHDFMEAIGVIEDIARGSTR